jgi:UDP-3-O-[3-hydroxymyristoyl] glucosamine N-acyltransferase
MEFSAEMIAGFIEGEIVGDKNAVVNDLTKIEEGRPGTLSFLANPKYEEYIYNTQSSIVIVGKDFNPKREISATLIKVEDAYAAFATIINAYQAAKQQSLVGISSNAFIDPSATIGENVYIGDFVFVGANASVGDNTKLYPQSYVGMSAKVGSDCLIHPGVKILDECIVGNECTLHAGVVIGSDGFGFAPQEDSDFRKIAQIGNAILEDRVELGANTCVDRATMGSTIIRRGVKLDNLIQVAHNVEIGENCVMASQSGISGSTKIGKNGMFGGQIGIAGHLTIGEGVRIAAQSGIGSSINDNITVMGSPAFEHKDYLASYINFRKLPKLAKRVQELEKELKALKNK